MVVAETASHACLVNLMASLTETLCDLPSSSYHKSELLFSEVNLEARDDTSIQRLEMACSGRWQKVEIHIGEVSRHNVTRGIVQNQQHMAILHCHLPVETGQPFSEQDDVIQAFVLNA